MNTISCGEGLLTLIRSTNYNLNTYFKRVKIRTWRKQQNEISSKHWIFQRNRRGSVLKCEHKCSSPNAIACCQGLLSLIRFTNCNLNTCFKRKKAHMVRTTERSICQTLHIPTKSKGLCAELRAQMFLAEHHFLWRMFVLSLKYRRITKNPTKRVLACSGVNTKTLQEYQRNTRKRLNFATKFTLKNS
jgi:hypothetical protein